jgi:hypothetical protein
MQAPVLPMFLRERGSSIFFRKYPVCQKTDFCVMDIPECAYNMKIEIPDLNALAALFEIV